MEVDEIVLTICIPTYNRKKFLAKQLAFFQKQVENNPNILQKVRFIVSDNASSDDTYKMLESWDKSLCFFDCYRNDKNLGLVGNIIASLNRSTTDYVWFVSDDDQLKDGIIERVLDALENNKPEFVFINYSSGNLENIGYKGSGGLHINGRSAALDIFEESYGSLVFMTACVYKRKNILELKDDNMFTWISSPMLFSFYSCSKGPIYIIEESMVIFNPGNASYAGIKRVLKIKFEEYVKILERLDDFGYDKNEVTKVIKHFFIKQSHSHFLYSFVNFSKSMKYYKYYNIRTFMYFPVNVVRYLIEKRL